MSLHAWVLVTKQAVEADGMSQTVKIIQKLQRTKSF